MKYGELPEHPPLGVFLYCAECDEKWSAMRGDYFLVQNMEMLCTECDAPLILASEQRSIVPL
jgi:hypothetical protein